jgi:VanZ family protein
MSGTLLRRIGQAVTALSAVLIAYATLSPDVAATGGNDQFGHFLLFFPLGIGGAFWLAPLPPATQNRARGLILLVILLFAAATEIGQMFIETRSASLPDFIADAAGAGLGVLLGGFVARRARRDPAEG